MEPSKTNQTRWEWDYITFTPSLHLVQFANYAHRTLYLHFGLSHPLKDCMTTHQQDTQHCLLHSLSHTRQPICAMFNSNNNKSSQHNSHLNMPYKHITAHGLYSFCIQNRPHLPCSVAIKIAATHDMTSPCTSTCTTYPCSAILNPLPSTQTTNTRRS